MHRMIVESSFPISCYYRFNDVFQLKPLNINNDIRKIEIVYNRKYYKPVKYANKHLENNNEYIEHVNKINNEDFLKEILALLSLLCNNTFRVEKEFSHEVYNNSLEIDEFPDCSELYSMSMIGNLLNQNMRTIDEFVVITKNADAYLEKYFKLDKKTLDRYRMSLMLYYNSTFIREYSPSMSYLALISSIENLMDLQDSINDVKHENCNECGQVKYKISKRFKMFIKEYYQEKDPEINLNKIINNIYSMRSKITHSGELMYMDYASSEFPVKEYHDFNYVMKIVRLCLFNWIVNRVI